MAPTTSFTVSELATMEIAGSYYSYATIRRVIAKAKIQSKGYGMKGAECYDLQEITDALVKYARKVTRGTAGESSLTELKVKKLEEDISKSKLEQERLTQEKERAQLEIKELKRKLVDSEEVRQYLLMRYAVEMALLRRILFVNAPIELPGLDKVKARIKCEDYFNLCQDTFGDTGLLWEQAHCDEEKELPDNIKRVITTLNNIFDEPIK